MISLKIANSDRIHKKISDKDYPQAIQSMEEAAHLLAEATEHESWSRLFKNLTTLQLERAQNEAKHAENQLQSAEEYMCTIMNIIHSSGFTVKFIDSHTPTLAVAKVNRDLDGTTTITTSVAGSLPISMPPRSKKAKRKESGSGVSATYNSTNSSKKVARVTTTTDAPTSARQAANEFASDIRQDKENVVDSEPPQRVVRANRGQGGHAFQLANAIKSNPSRSGHKKATADSSVPVSLPDNAMAPPQKGNNKKRGPIVNATNLSHFNLPQAGASKPMLQMAAQGSRFGFPASTQSQNPATGRTPNHIQVPNPRAAKDKDSDMYYNPDNNGDYYGGSNHDKSDDAIEDDSNDEGNGRDNNHDNDYEDVNGDEDKGDNGYEDYKGNNGNEDYQLEGGDDYQGDNSGNEYEGDNTDDYAGDDYDNNAGNNYEGGNDYEDGDIMGHATREDDIVPGDNIAFDIASLPDIDIDEASPSEDEAAAQAALHGPEAQDVDVLLEHRNRNRPVHPPNTENLAIASATQWRAQQAGLSDDANLNDDGSQANLEDTVIHDDNEENGAIRQRAPRNSKIPKGCTSSKPTTLKHYSKIWQAMLVLAKNNMRRHVALIHAFPERDNHLNEAENILLNTITEYKEENILDDGHKPNRDMAILVFNEHSNFRGQMKKVAREVVRTRYLHSLSSDFEGGNQLEEYEMIKDGVTDLLNEGRFLRGGVDQNGKTKNLGHSAIEALALQFYYTGNDCLANLFPNDFERTIPDHAFALLLTCIQNCLEEYVDHGYRLGNGVNFQGDKYRGIHRNYLEMISQVKMNNYHGVQFEARRAEWARKGMKNLKRDEAPVNRYRPALCLD